MKNVIFQLLMKPICQQKLTLWVYNKTLKQIEIVFRMLI